jgi:hypothetical protein
MEKQTTKTLIIIAVIFISGFLLSGCSLVSKNKSEIKKEPNLTKQQIFENNESCQKRRNDVDKIISKDDEFSGLKTELIEIFYSPENNSCLYSWSRYLSQDEIKRRAYGVYDVNSGEPIINILVLAKNDEYEDEFKDINPCKEIGLTNGLLCLYNQVNKLKGN